MILNNLIFIFVFILFIYYSYCFKGFTIEIQGKNILTAKITGQGDCTSIALTEEGTLIKYKSDSSIISTYKFSNSNVLVKGYSKSFMCQYSNNKVVLTRDKSIYEIEFKSNGVDTIIKIGDVSENIISLHCDKTTNNYIYTYLSSNSQQYMFKLSNNNSPYDSASQSNTISSSSCFIISSTLVLCINIINAQKKIQYFYHNPQSLTSTPISGEINLDDDSIYEIYEIKGSMIKYYANDEILLCLIVKPELISDIFLYCYMLNADINSNPKKLEIKSTESPVFKAIEKIETDINFCQIEKLSDNLYASVCLSYYYRTSYLLSIFKFNSNKFEIYTNTNDFQNLKFELLKRSKISLTAFNENTLGIFYRDIDDDSMIHVFYPNCGKDFDNVPKEGENTCQELSSTPISGFYFDECSHRFSKLPTGYLTYEKNQFCQIKNIACDNINYFLDIDDNDTKYICRNKENINLRRNYFFDLSETDNNKKFKKCFRSCLTCNVIGTEDDNKCLTCDEEKGFYSFGFIASKPNQCYHKDVPIEHYYFNQQSNGFKECRKECLTCTEFSPDLSEDQNDKTDESKDTKCTKCNTNYFPQVDKPSNCIRYDRNNPSNENNIKYHYFNSDYQRWEKCTDGCIYCSKYGDSIYETNCEKIGNVYCDTEKDYYPVEYDDPSDTTINNKCFKKGNRYDYYYFNEDFNMFKKCPTPCLQCDNNRTCLVDKCDTKNNYFPREDNHAICYEYKKNPYKYIYNYYFDPNTKLFKRCHKSCDKCKEQIDVSDDDTQCNKCKNIDSYYPLEGTESNTDNINCYHKNRIGYYLNDDTYIIHKCPEKCSKCEYTSLSSSGSKEAYCTSCNNELKFYQVEGLFHIYESTNEVSKYMPCYTWRAEKLLSPTTNEQPPLNTLLVGNVFKICHQACTQCTAISPNTEKFITHCQAKKCNTDYYYVQNNEDICYPKDEYFPLHFAYYDPILNEYYFKPCYQTCQKCAGDGTKRNNNCTECREGYIWHPNDVTNGGNCIFDCLKLAHNNYYYLDEDNNDEYICVEKCPEEYPFLQPVKKRCLKSCDTDSELKYSKDRICVKKCPDKTTDNLKKECVSVSNECIKSDLESNLILYDINDTNINKIIVDYCHDYSYTSSQVNNVMNKLNEFNITIYKNKKCVHEFYGNNINFPDLSVCFNDLREHYDISPTQDFIVMIMNIYNGDSYIKVEYKVFDSITCQELDLANCSIKNIFTDIDMSLYFDASDIRKSKDMYINKNINVYDRDHPFFTDICYQYTYKGDKDMILQDRVDIYYQDISKICEKNCKPQADFDKKLIRCGCDLKEKFLVNNDESVDDKWNFGVNGVSVDVLKCSGKAFLWENFKENIGSYTALVLIVAEFPVVIYFIINGLSQVKIFLIPFMGSNPPKKKSINGSSENAESNKESNSNSKKSENESENNDNNINNVINSEKINKLSSSHSRSLKKLQTIKTISSNLQSSKGFSDNKTEDSLIKKDLSESRQEFVKKKYDIYKDIIDIEDLNDVELYDARNLDKRTFCQFYYQELKNTQPIIYSFFYYTHLTPRYFKILHFIFNTTLCFVLNAFFFSKYYISEKCFDFENSFYWYFTNIYDRIIYTCVCTVMVSLILRVLTSSKKKMFMWIKREKDPEVFNKEITKMMNKLKLNYIIYSSVQGAFMFLFWLYLSCFCIAYKNNEIEWFVTSWICFGIIQIWYFISTFIVTCLRFLGIKCGMESCYNASLCLAFD